MKKVGKEFKKTLSAILVAAMVFTSLPQTTLVAKAAEEDQQQTVDVSEYAEVGGNESTDVSKAVSYDVKNENGQAVSGITVTATVKENETNYYVSGVSLGDASVNYELVSVGGETKTEKIEGADWYVFEKPADKVIPVKVKYRPKNITVASTAGGAALTDATVTFVSGTTGAGTSESPYKTVEKRSVQFKVAVKDGVAGEITNVQYQIGTGDVKTANTLTDGVTYTIPNTSNQINADVKIIVTVAATYAVTVTATGATTTPDVKYAPITADSADDFKTLTSGTKLKDGSYYIAVDAGTNNVVKSVGYKATSNEGAATDVTSTAKVVDGLTVYTVTIGTEAATLEIVTEAATKTVDVTATGDGIKGVYYTTATDDPATIPEYDSAKFTKVSGGKIALNAGVKHLYVYVDYAENYIVDEVKINGTADSAAAVGKVYEVAITDASSFAVKAKKEPVVYTFAALKDFDETTAVETHATVTIDKANIISVGDATTAPTADVVISKTDNTAKAIKVAKGDTLTFRVAVDEGYEATVTGAKKVTTATDEYYEIEASDNANVTVSVAAKAALEVTFVANANVTKIEEKINGKATENTSIGSTIRVPYNGSYEFAIKEYANNATVDYVRYKVGAATTWTVLAAPYKIENIKEAVQIQIVTKLDAAKMNAFSIEYNKNEATVAVQSPALASVYEADGTPATGITSKTTYYVAPSDSDNTVKFTVTPQAGLKATVEGAAPAENTTTPYIINFGKTGTTANKGQTKAVKITTAPDDTEITANQFVQFEAYNETDAKRITIDVKDATVVDEANCIYEIAKTIKEVAFTVTVPYDKELTSLADNTAIFETAPVKVSADGKYNVYSYKILVSQVKNTTKENPKTISLNQLTTKMVALAINGSATVEIINGSVTVDEDVITNNNQSYIIGTKLLITVADGAKLYKVGETNAQTGVTTETELELDAYNKYSFKITEDTTLKVVPATEADLTTGYTISVQKYIVDEDEQDENVGAASSHDGFVAVDGVSLGDLFKITADKSGAIEFSKIEVAEEIKSSITLSENKKTVKVAIAAEDAGKDIAVDLFTDVNETAVVKDKFVGSVVFTVDPTAKSVVVKDVNDKVVKNNSKVTVDALSDSYYNVTITPEGVHDDYYDVVVESGKATTATFDKEYGYGYIKVTAPEKAETAKVSIVDKTKSKDNVLFSFTVETKLPALKLSKVDSVAQSTNTINLTLTSDKSVKDIANGKVYYEVSVSPKEVKDKTAPTGSDAKVYYILKDVADTQSHVFTVNNATQDTGWTYDFAVRLVLSKTTLSDTYAAASAPKDESFVAVGNTIKKSFTTKNATYFEDKLSVTKKTTTIYTGQDDVLAAIVKFSKNASKVENVQVKRVLNSAGEAEYGIYAVGGDDIEATNGYEVRLGVATDVAPGKYTVEIVADSVAKGDADTDLVAGEYSMYRATATLPITVVAGINRISVTDDVKVAQDGKKDVTYTIKPVGYSGYGTKAKSQKFTYKLEAYGDQYDNVMKNVVVNPTNGKVTIKKGFVVGNDASDNKFDVIIRPADFANNYSLWRNGTHEYDYERVTIEVTKAKMEIGEISLVSQSTGKALGTVLDKSVANSEDTHLVIKDTEGNDITQYVTVTPSYKYNTNSVQYDTYNGPAHYCLNIVKSGKMTIKATTTDGGKKSKTLPITINYDKFTNMNYTLTSGDTTVVETAQDTWNYKATSTPLLILDVKDGNGNASKYDYNYSVKVTGGVINNSNIYNNYQTGIIPTAKVTKITLKDTAKGGKTFNITVTNDTYPNDKAPKATTKDKLYKGLYTFGEYGAISKVQNLKFTVSGKKYDYVYVTANSDDYYDLAEIQPIAISADNTFTLTNNNAIEVSKYSNSVKYTLVYGTVNGGKFIPQTQPTTLTVKATNAAAFKPTTSYTINAANNRTIELTGKPDYVDVAFYNLQNANVGGQPNKFRDLFTLEDNKLILKDVTANDAIKAAYADKKNYTGYVTYDYINTNGEFITKTTKITVKFNEKALKYTADAVEVLKGTATEVNTTIRLNKNAVALSAAATDLKTETAGWTVTTTEENAAEGIITLKYTGTETGKQTVDVKFITESSANAGKGGSTGFDAFDKVSVAVNVVDPATSAKKIAIVKGTVDLNSKDVVKTYNTTNATGVYTLAVADTYKVLTEGTVVTAMAVDTEAKNAPTDITVSFDAENNATVFAVNAKDLKAGKKISVPVKVTFANNAAPETYVFTVVAPKTIPTVDTVTAAVKAYVASFHRTGNASAATADATAIQTALNTTVIDPLTGITAAVTANYVDEVKDSTGAVTTAASYTVDVTLTVPGATDPVKLEKLAVLAPEVAKQDLAAAKTDVEALINKIVKEKTGTEAEKATQKLATELNTRFALRAYLQPAITNSDIMLQITDYVYTAPVDGTEANPTGTPGSLTFTCTVLTQTDSQVVVQNKVIDNIPAKAYVAPTPAP